MYNVPIHSYMSISDILTIWPYFRTHILTIIHDKKKLTSLEKFMKETLRMRVFMSIKCIFLSWKKPKGAVIFFKTFFCPIFAIQTLIMDWSRVKGKKYVSKKGLSGVRRRECKIGLGIKQKKSRPSNCMTCMTRYAIERPRF